MPAFMMRLLASLLWGLLPPLALAGPAASASPPPARTADPATSPQANAPETPLQALIEAFIQQQMQEQGLDGQPHIQLDIAKLGKQPACEQAEAFLAGNAVLRSRFSVGLRCLSPEHWVAYVPVQLRVMGHYPVAARPLSPSLTLSENDITLREGDLLRLPPGVAVSADDILGYTTVQRIAASQPFKHNTLQAPHSIMRGQPVTLEVRGEGFTVSGEGTALQAGAPGAVIQARTPSGQIVQGRVINAQTVLLLM